MRVLIIGSGGREHALAWKIAQSRRVKKVYCAPGNGGMEDIAECRDISGTDVRGLLEFAVSEHIDLVAVGPEGPLAMGIVDEFDAKGIRCFGPSRGAARLESSKSYAKRFMYRKNIPTPAAEVFSTSRDAIEWVSHGRVPVVVKADGLAAGKGVVIAMETEEAVSAIRAMMDQKILGSAGNSVVLDTMVRGEEASVQAICDGKNFMVLPWAQDHKRIYDGDKGPNTGGMGAYSPIPRITYRVQNVIERMIFQPAVAGMAEEGFPFKGVLYAGIMLEEALAAGINPTVLEFNVRFGDPESQVILPRLKADIVEIMMAAIDGNLDAVKVPVDERACVCVVLASGGYPEKYEKGKKIHGLKEAGSLKDVMIFHAGTRRVPGAPDNYVTEGGRVLGVTALGDNIREAHSKVYEAVRMIRFEGMQYRRDIGLRAINPAVFGSA
jgi:phosphoribosylamine--glycine ligase